MTRKFLPLILLITFCGEMTHYRDAALRSFYKTDLVIVPHKGNILDDKWIFSERTATFADGKRKIQSTTHYTGYDYDAEIPLLFFGKWFKKGNYSMPALQQHIAPTIAKITGVGHSFAVAPLPVINQQTTMPEIVVFVVIDQGGKRAFQLHKKYLPNIRKLQQSSAYFNNARVGHLDTHTASGHAAIGSGTFPAENGIIANSLFIPKPEGLGQKKVYQNGFVDPSELKVPTLADLLDKQYANAPVVISQSYATRASVGMGGHGSGFPGGDRDFVYWLSSADVRWETEGRFFALPQAAKFSDPHSVFMANYAGGFRDVVPKKRNEWKQDWYGIMATPAELKEEVRLFRQVIQEEILGKNLGNDGKPDLAYLTIKATDAAGHAYGQESLEMRETLAEADRQIGELLQFLEKNFGDRFVLVMTADHGCAPLAETSGGQKMEVKDFLREINSLVPDKTQSLVLFMTQGQIALNFETMKKYGVSREQIVQKILSMEMNGRKFFRDVIENPR